jgi:Tfp pilus assembly protein PilX
MLYGLGVKSKAGSKVCGKAKEKGAVLIVGLILLMVITLLALAGIQGVSMQQRMSGNAYDHNIAFNAAEIGLRWAENKLLTGKESELGTLHEADEPAVDDSKFESGGGVWDKEHPNDKVNAKVTVIKLEDENCFKVNSLGQGRDSKTEVVLQSIVCRGG